MATKKLKERVKKLIITPYDYHVYIVLTNDQKQSAGRRGITTQENWYAMHVHNDNLTSVIILPYDCGVKTVTHETFHCVWAIMKTIGAEFENEVMAYTMGYIVGEICAFMDKHRPGGWKKVGTQI